MTQIGESVFGYLTSDEVAEHLIKTGSGMLLTMGRKVRRLYMGTGEAVAWLRRHPSFSYRAWYDEEGLNVRALSGLDIGESLI